MKLSSMPADTGTAAGRPNPPASWLGLKPARQLQQRERVPARLGDDPLQHRSSRGAGKTDSNSDRASRRPRGSTRSSGKPASASPSSRVANTSAILSASRRRATKARSVRTHDRATARHQRCIGVAAPRRPRPAARGRPARPGTGRARVPYCSPNATPSASCCGCGRRSIKVEERRTELLNRRERKLHLGLDPGRPRDPKPSRLADSAHSSRAVLPTPASPCTTNTPPWPPRTPSSSRSSTSRSRSRPSNRVADTRIGGDAPYIPPKHAGRPTLGRRLRVQGFEHQGDASASVRRMLDPKDAWPVLTAGRSSTPEAAYDRAS